MGNAVISGILFQPPSPPFTLAYFGPNNNTIADTNNSVDEDTTNPSPQSSHTTTSSASPSPASSLCSHRNNGNYPSVNYLWIRTSTGTFLPAVHIVHSNNSSSHFSNHDRHNQQGSNATAPDHKIKTDHNHNNNHNHNNINNINNNNNGNPPPGKYTLLYSHGNAEDIGLIANFLTDLSRLLGINILCFDYSGYGVSTDKVYASVMLREYGGELDRWQRWRNHRRRRGHESGGDDGGGAERRGLVGWIERGSLDLSTLDEGANDGSSCDGGSGGCDVIVDGSGCFASSLMDREHDEEECDAADRVPEDGATEEHSRRNRDDDGRNHPLKAAVGWGRDIFVAPMVHPVNYTTGAIAKAAGSGGTTTASVAKDRDEFDFDENESEEDATGNHGGESNGGDLGPMPPRERDAAGDDADGGYFFNTCGAVYQAEEPISHPTATNAAPTANTDGIDDTGAAREGRPPKKNLSPKIRRARLLEKHSWRSPTPSEAQCYVDIEAAYAYLTEIEKVHPKDILLYGKSVGSGPTCYLAQKLCDESELAKERRQIEEEEDKERQRKETQERRQMNAIGKGGGTGDYGSTRNGSHTSSSDDESSSLGQDARDDESDYHACRRRDNEFHLKDVAPGGVILHSPFLSVIRVVLDVGFTTIGDLFPNVDRVKDLTCSVYVIHGTDDEIVPFYHGESLFNLLPDSSKTVPFWARGACHNNIEMEMPTAYIKRLQQFVRQCHRTHNPPPPLPISTGIAASMRMPTCSSMRRGPTTANEVLHNFRQQRMVGQRPCIKRYASQDTFHENRVEDGRKDCHARMIDAGVNDFNNGHSTVKTKKSSKQRKKKGTLVMKSSHDHLAHQSYGANDNVASQTLRPRSPPPTSTASTQPMIDTGLHDGQVNSTAHFNNVIQGRYPQISSHQQHGFRDTVSSQFRQMNLHQEQMQMQKLYNQNQYHSQQQQQQQQQNHQYVDQHRYYHRSASSVTSVSSRPSSQFSVQQTMQQQNHHRAVMPESNHFVRHYGFVSQSTHGYQ